MNGGSIFDPSGFGVVHHYADASSSFTREYPQATMQFMAAFRLQSEKSLSSVYVGAHDPNGSSKSLGCSVSLDRSTARFSVSAVPPGAGLPLNSFLQYSVCGLSCGCGSL